MPRNPLNDDLHTRALSVEYEVLDIDLDRVLLDVHFGTRGGGKKELIPRSMIDEPRQALKILYDRGAIFPSSKAPLEMVKELLSTSGRPTRSVTRRCGWIDNKIYLRPQFCEGKNGHRFEHLNTLLDQAINVSRGNAKDWQNGCTSPCRYSPYLSFAIGIGYGAPLLEILGESESVIFNFHSESSSGKTSIARACQSMFARAEKFDLANYRMTDAGRDQLCFARNDLVVVIDDEGSADGNKVRRRESLRKTAFAVASGRGKITDAHYRRRADVVEQTWKLIAITSSEEALESSDGGGFRSGGERVRHIDIEVPSLSKGGVFSLIRNRKKGPTSRELAEMVEHTIDQNYGVALQPYIQSLIKLDQSELGRRIRALVDQFVDEVGAATDSWETRFAKRFGLVLAGMTLAAEFGLAPWSKSLALKHVKRVYRAARRSVHSIEKAKVDFVGRVDRLWRRLPELNEGTKVRRRERKAIGFRRDHRKLGRIVAIDPNWFDRRFRSKAEANAVFDSLLAEGICVRSPNGKRHVQIQVQGLRSGGRRRWVCFKEAKLKDRLE